MTQNPQNCDKSTARGPWAAQRHQTHGTVSKRKQWLHHPSVATPATCTRFSSSGLIDPQPLSTTQHRSIQNKYPACPSSAQPHHACQLTSFLSPPTTPCPALPRRPPSLQRPGTTFAINQQSSTLGRTQPPDTLLSDRQGLCNLTHLSAFLSFSADNDNL